MFSNPSIAVMRGALFWAGAGHGREGDKVSGDAAIIEAMRRAVPPGRTQLGDADEQAAPEYQRFLAVADRGLCVPEEEVAAKLSGATVLVTGGTGCIGSVLMREIAARGPARLVSVSVSRGITRVAAPADGAEYLKADVTDRAEVERVIADVRPGSVFHVAAQRSPALAEIEVRRTASTNVLGARNVLAAASHVGVGQVVLASTGKALRPYSPEIYTASKRAAEWIGATAAASGDVTCSAARFTHVIDNSIVHQRLLDWTAPGGDGAPADGEQVIRLHSPDIAFYVQSALESAHLLLLAMLGAEAGEFRVHAIADLGWPVSLLDVALGTVAAASSRTPVYISGYDPGYEEVPFPGLYDPATAGDVSPLLNAFEAAALTARPCPRVDTFTLNMVPDPVAPKLLAGLESAFDRRLCDAEVRQALDDLSWALLDATLAAADPTVLARAARLTRLHEKAMSPVHLRITRAINAQATSVAENRR
jgi:nucleoside-diphosphate-sugar epimerase